MSEAQILQWDEELFCWFTLAAVKMCLTDPRACVWKSVRPGMRWLLWEADLDMSAVESRFEYLQVFWCLVWNTWKNKKQDKRCPFQVTCKMHPCSQQPLQSFNLEYKEEKSSVKLGLLRKKKVFVREYVSSIMRGIACFRGFINQYANQINYLLTVSNNLTIKHTSSDSCPVICYTF